MMSSNLITIISGMKAWLNLTEAADVIFHFRRKKEEQNNCCYRYEG